MERVGLGVREVVFSDYIIYADESGDPNPVSVDPNYPVFVLNFCVFRKHDYAASVLPAVAAVAAFKFEHFGHDAVVLHENDIHMRRPPFVFLRDEQRRSLFMDRLDWLGSVDISRHSGESRNPGALESRHRSHSGYSGFPLSRE